MATFTETIEFVIINCPSCNCHFGMTRAHFDRKKNASSSLGHFDRANPEASYYCPNGHAMQQAGPTDQKRLRELESELANERGRRQLAEMEAEKARITAKRETTRRKNVQKRADAGVCQHCHRSFKDVQGHMERQHPAHFPVGMRGHDKLAAKK
jgi:hypothetical protein